MTHPWSGCVFTVFTIYEIHIPSHLDLKVYIRPCEEDLTLRNITSQSYTSLSSLSSFGSPMSLINRSMATEIAQDAFKARKGGESAKHQKFYTKPGIMPGKKVIKTVGNGNHVSSAKKFHFDRVSMGNECKITAYGSLMCTLHTTYKRIVHQQDIRCFPSVKGKY